MIAKYKVGAHSTNSKLVAEVARLQQSARTLASSATLLDYRADVQPVSSYSDELAAGVFSERS